jgi:TIR domain
LSPLPKTVKAADLLRWVTANTNKPFDPAMVVDTKHTSDFEWKTVTAQMEELRRQGYIIKLNEDAWGSTYWTITSEGVVYLASLEYEQNFPKATPRPKTHEEWDVFISHASEDKDAVARPLTKAFREKGLRVWYDEILLTVGDSLRKKIDQGLASCRFGVVILSPHFFEKHWPEQELNGLATREVNGQKVILPVWHKVDFEAVRRYSPTLADRFAVNTDMGLPYVIDKLMEAIKAAPRMPDYKIVRLNGGGIGIRVESDRAGNRTGTGSSTKGLTVVFRTGYEALQYVKSGEAEGYTFDGKEFLPPLQG